MIPTRYPFLCRSILRFRIESRRSSRVSLPRSPRLRSPVRRSLTAASWSWRTWSKALRRATHLLPNTWSSWSRTRRGSVGWRGSKVTREPQSGDSTDSVRPYRLPRRLLLRLTQPQRPLDLPRDVHRAELRPAHRAKLGALEVLCRQSLVV